MLFRIGPASAAESKNRHLVGLAVRLRIVGPRHVTVHRTVRLMIHTHQRVRRLLGAKSYLARLLRPGLREWAAFNAIAGRADHIIVSSVELATRRALVKKPEAIGAAPLQRERRV